MERSYYQPKERRNFALILVGIIVVGLIVLGIENRLTATKGASTTTTRQAISTTTTQVPLWKKTFSVGVQSQIVQESLGAGHIRVISTTIRYPVVKSQSTSEIAQGTPDVTDGPYPLIVFSQGFDISANVYSQLIDTWVAAGFVVLSPEYPYTDPSFPGGVDRSDLVNHPRDLSYIITWALDQNEISGSVLFKLIDPNEIAVAGQSDGGDVSLAVGFGTCCLDSRVKAVVSLSGAEYAPFGGTYFSGPALPFLVTQGTADDINPPSCSVQIYNAAGAPKFYLSLLGANHLEPYSGTDTYLPITENVSTEFLESYLQHDPNSQAQMQSSGNQIGISTLQEDGTVPQVAGTCPGAPAS